MSLIARVFPQRAVELVSPVQVIGQGEPSFCKRLQGACYSRNVCAHKWKSEFERQNTADATGGWGVAAVMC